MRQWTCSWIDTSASFWTTLLWLKSEVERQCLLLYVLLILPRGNHHVSSYCRSHHIYFSTLSVLADFIYPFHTSFKHSTLLARVYCTCCQLATLDMKHAHKPWNSPVGVVDADLVHVDGNNVCIMHVMRYLSFRQRSSWRLEELVHRRISAVVPSFFGPLL